jgi:hypothetical protein
MYLTLVVCVSGHAQVSDNGTSESLRTASAGPLRASVPFAPMAFASPSSGYLAYKLRPPTAGEPLTLQRIEPSHQQNSRPRASETHLAYELVLTNVGSSSLTLQRIEILDGSRRNAKPIAAYEGLELEALLAFLERQHAEADSDRLQLRAGETVVANLFLSFQRRAFVPGTLHHRLYTTDAVTEGPFVGTRHSQMRVLGSPLRGGNWFAMGGPGAIGATTYHRQNTFMLNGRPEASRRYGIDWVKIEKGKMHADEQADSASYYGYGQEVLAVADGVIATAVDGMQENIPGHVPPLQPVTSLCLPCGNHVVLKLSDGQFATYMHLQPGSLRVAKGDRVRRGQVLGLLGNSGDSFLPHLHFQVATEPGMTGQGLPYLLEKFSIIDPTGAKKQRTRELPLDGMVIDFGSSRGRAVEDTH